ncbi:MAG: MFS transporter [Anaerolineae bacterium]
MSQASAAAPLKSTQIPKIIAAASLGTMIEWYDFYLFGSLTTVIASKFFNSTNPNEDILLWLAAYATGFLVRPFGAIVFGRVGDLIGRKYTFLVTMTIMAMGTGLLGLLPDKTVIGGLAPLILVLLRLAQGLALGGEYGGAATYIAEHAPDDKRGFYTSFIQITATAGFFISLLVILATRSALGTTTFADWGWRIPFLFSFLLLGVSLYIRISMAESPLYSKLKKEGKTSKNPLVESFVNPENRRMVLIALFGATAGQGVVWYTGQFYALVFLQTLLKVDLAPAYLIISAALLFGSPFFVIMGRLSDRIGRKWIILSGCLIAAIAIVPIYMAMAHFGPFTDPWLHTAADAANNPAYSPIALSFLVWLQLLLVTMVYGPIAAFLVELFPTRIRYTSMSLPYHLGNGWFGGLLPVIATSLVNANAPAAGQDISTTPLGPNYMYVGLVFPVVVALITFIIGARYVRDHKGQHFESIGAEPLTGADPVPAAGQD